jgi:2-oxopent-4-enoate/cis-2-oxohex-4-enoate hydratase
MFSREEVRVMEVIDLQALADVLDEAARTGVACAPLTDAHPELTAEQAYTIQTINHGRRTGARVGYKVGLTSEAVQRWLNVDVPDFGGLFEEMAVGEGGVCELSARKMLQPRAEAEIAFIARERLMGPGLMAESVVDKLECCMASIEIIDSRVKDWKIKYADTVADNASSAAFVVSSYRVGLRGLDLKALKMELRKNGELVSTGVGAACLGDPLAAVAWLANTLGELGEAIEPGQLVLSGALGPVTPVASGDVLVASIDKLGEVRVSFV